MMGFSRYWLALSLMVLSGHVWAQEIKIAVGEGKPPYTFSSPPGGIEYDMIETVVTRMGRKPSLILVPNARARALLDEGKIDGAIGTTAAEGQFASEPYIAYQNAAISLKSRGLVIGRVADLRGYRVVGFQNARLFLGAEFGDMAAANRDYREISPQVVANQLLFSGRADVVISDVHIFDWLNRQAHVVDVSQPVTIHHLFPPTRYRIIFRDPVLRDGFNKALQTVLAENPFPALTKKYLPDPLGADFKP